MQNKFFLLFVSVVILSGCSTHTSKTQESVKVHMQESQNLSLLMREIDLVVYDRFKSELERDDIRRRHALSLSKVLKDLAYKIENVSVNSLPPHIKESDIYLYRQYSQKLYKSANSIYESAQNYEMEKIPEQLQEMENICTSCHLQLKDK